VQLAAGFLAKAGEAQEIKSVNQPDEAVKQRQEAEAEAGAELK
jgi:hypothetical protein